MDNGIGGSLEILIFLHKNLAGAGRAPDGAPFASGRQRRNFLKFNIFYCEKIASPKKYGTGTLDGMKKITLASLSLFWSLAAPFSAWAAHPLPVPEKLEYEVHWSGIKAGSAVQEVTPHNGELHLVYTVRSSGLVNTFFPIDDRSESVLTRGSGAESFGMPRLFRERINEGKTHTNKEALFDLQQLKVETKDFLKHTEKTDSITPKTFDTLSCIYFIRSAELEPGKPVHMEVYDLKRLWNAEVRVVRREELRTPVGKFKTIVVRPVLTAEGQQPRTDYMTVWLSDDSRRIPVKLVVKLKVGEFRATLSGGSYWP